MNASSKLRPKRFIFVTLLTAVLTCMLIAGTANADSAIESKAPPAFPSVQIELGEWRSDLPPGVSLIVKGGGLINESFPALSGDRTGIAVFYYAGRPPMHGYPTLDIYSTATLALQKRIDFFPEHQQLTESTKSDLNLLDPEIVTRVERRLVGANRYLAEGVFRPMPLLFDFTKQRSPKPMENLDKRIEYVARNQVSVLTITSLTTNRVELAMEMPTVPLFTGSDDPENDCVVQGGVLQGWHEAKQRIFVLRMHLDGGRDGCELPERWLIKRQQSPTQSSTSVD